MSELIEASPSAPSEARRSFLRGTGSFLLSGSAIALLAGNATLAAAAESGSSDVTILNTALGAEYEAIAAY